MGKYIEITILVLIYAFFANTINASTTDSPCHEYLRSKGFPKNPRTVMEFKYINIALGELKQNSPNCIPNFSEKSPIIFEALFSEKTINTLIISYPSHQVVQMALLDLKTEISSISYWYITQDGEFGIERAKLYLLQFYVMLKSLELFSQNIGDSTIDSQQLNFIKEVVFNDLGVVESYISYKKFFGNLNEKQHKYIRSRFRSYINRLKSIAILKQDIEYRDRLENVIQSLN